MCKITINNTIYITAQITQSKSYTMSCSLHTYTKHGTSMLTSPMITQKVEREKLLRLFPLGSYYEDNGRMRVLL